MVKKLYKYEFINLGKWMIIIFAAVVLMAGATRLTLEFADDESNLGVAAQIGAVMSFGLTVIFAFAISMILPVVRFYKNLLTHEGYLTLSLPISINQHLICKLTVALVMQIVAFISFIAAGLVFTAGTEVLPQMWQVLCTAFSRLWEEVGVNTVFFTIEFVLIVLLSMILAMLRYYFCMSMGQLFGKNRIVGAVLVYILLSIGTQIIASIASGILLPLGAYFINQLTEVSVILAVHILFAVILVFTAAFIAAFYAVTHYMFKHRLNLA